ncbi:MAG: hypothetical protein A2Y10_17565 [Planctomycetes bacterium GWF2_41_51]|nr:MAG: hypothetical protein A2Y10_17565 [Planctomycetes bacterium GWF2_41_51]HBG28035.1 hypothetical protein [Phycisphaerales bacterium]
MSRKLNYITIILCCLLLPLENIYAELIVSESFDYPVGPLNAANGGTGWNGAWQETSADGDANIVAGLKFEDYSSIGNAARLKITNLSGYVVCTATRNFGVDFPKAASYEPVGSDDLWVSFLYKQSGAPLTDNNSRIAEIRNAAGPRFRMKPKNGSSQGVALGYDTTLTAESSKTVQDGSIYMFIVKFPDINETSGSNANMWVLTDANYAAIKTDGITESELNSNSYMFVSEIHSQRDFTSDNAIELVLADSSETGFEATLDEIRYGTTLNDVIKNINSQLLIRESFDYMIGDSLNGKNGGAGWMGAWIDTDSDGDANITEGLDFSDYPVSGGAAKLTITNLSGYVDFVVNRSIGLDCPSAARDLWVSFLYKQPGAPLASNTSRSAEIRNASGPRLRMKAKNGSSQGIALGYDTTLTANGTKTVQDGNTYMFIVKFSDIDEESGNEAKMWVLTESDYDTIKTSGISESELNSNYYLLVTEPHANRSFSSSDSIQLALGDSSETGFSAVFDEIRYGVTLEDITEIREQFVLADDLLIGGDFKDAYASGGTPIDIAVGDFSTTRPGDEIAVIWDEPVSQVYDQFYYTIVIYDQNGVELDRAGRSLTKWQHITCGNLIWDNSYAAINDTYEIAAVKAEADANGHYPVYFFRKAFKDPFTVLMTTNASRITDITGGNFKTDGDEYDEVALITAGSNIYYCKPTDANWSATTTNISEALIAVASGNFDANSTNGDEVVGISNVLVDSKRPARLFKPGGSGYYNSAATQQNLTLAGVAAGDFDGNSINGDEIALASYYSYYVKFYYPGSTGSFKTYAEPLLGVKANAVCSGSLAMNTSLTNYDDVNGFSSGDYGTEIGSWGDHVLFLPSESQKINIPAYWINCKIDTSYYHSRTVPLIR